MFAGNVDKIFMNNAPVAKSEPESEPEVIAEDEDLSVRVKRILKEEMSGLFDRDVRSRRDRAPRDSQKPKIEE